MERYLDKCLSSLVVPEDQMSLLEVLVVNDGSKDRSSAIAHGYERRYPDTFRVIDKENGNYGSCVNRGLTEASGKYIKILDADDSFDNAVFCSFLLFLQKMDADMVLSAFVVVDEQGTIQRKHSYLLPENVQLPFSEAARSFNASELQMHAVAYRTANLRRMGYKQMEGISYTDQQWIFTPLVTVATVVYFDKPLYRYLVGREGQTMSGAVMSRSLSQHVQCAEGIIADYERFATLDNDAHGYMLQQAEHCVKALYWLYLVKFDGVPFERLVKFDDYIQSRGGSWVKCTDEDTLGKTRWHYIRRWRKDRSQRLPRRELVFYSRLSRLLQIIHR